MKLFVTIIFLVFTTIVIAGNSKNNLLIIPFTNATEEQQYDSLQEGLPDLLTACFSTYDGLISIVDRYALDEIVNEQSLSWEKYIDSQTIQSVGKLVNANYILRGSIVKATNEIQIQTLLFETSTTILRLSTTYQSNEESFVKKLCNKISSPIAQYLQSSQQEHTQIKIENNPEKQQLLITGLNHYYNGDFAQAFAPFLKLVKAYPDDAMPHYWLAQSFYQAGLDEFATIRFQEFINRFQNNPRTVKVKSLLKELELRKQDYGVSQ